MDDCIIFFRLSPIGVLFLVSSKIMEMESFDVILGQLGMYFMTVLIGLFIHGFVVLPTIFFLFTKKNPIIYISNMTQAIATAFGTSSSSATLPVAIGCLEDRNGIDSRVSRFVMPIGATINMDGTALYEAVAAIFIAQVRNFPLSFGQLVAVRWVSDFCPEFPENLWEIFSPVEIHFFNLLILASLRLQRASERPESRKLASSRWSWFWTLWVFQPRTSLLSLLLIGYCKFFFNQLKNSELKTNWVKMTQCVFRG